MCLYVGNKIALVASKDIEVYKCLKKNGSRYETPYQGTEVELNNTLKANEIVDNPQRECYNKYCIEGGAIHAFISHVDRDAYVFKAYIKEGTRFYVQDDFTQVAAEELYITDEQVIGTDIKSPDIALIAKEYLEAVYKDGSFNGKDGVKVGYYLMSDKKTYVSPFDDVDKDDAIGIVAFFKKDGTPAVMSLEDKRLPWLTKYDMKNKVQSQIEYNDTTKDMDGQKHTNDIAKSEDYDPDLFKAVEYCRSYKTKNTKKGDWYMPAIGECVKVAQNVGIINAVILIAGVGDAMDFDWMWSSSERSSGGWSYAWKCSFYYGYCNYYYYYRDSYGQVRPLLSLARARRSLLARLSGLLFKRR